MLTLENLKEYGADVDAGVARCMGMQDFYLRLVKMELEDESFSLLREAMERKDAKAAFDAVHALKGAVGNLSLTPLYEALCEMTELLRAAQTMPDTSAVYSQVCLAFDQLQTLAN